MVLPTLSYPGTAYGNIAGMHRDGDYWHVLKRDLRRQWTRRIARSINSRVEKLTNVRQWEKAAQAYDEGRLKKPTLSTCIITMNSQDRIRPLLEYIRSFTDEIVVGVDSKTTDDTFAACEGLADELFIIESTALTCNAGLEPLVSRCHGDWILRLDDDEFPEPELARWLPGILTQPDITHYKMPRLHLSNIDPLEWINDSYLYPDYQMRLCLNKKELLTFPGAVGHTQIECSGKRGKIHSANLVHLNMAINPRFKREAKLHTYIKRLDGEWVHPVNEHALLFENFPYRIEPYRHPDEDFCKRLIETTRQQRAIYEKNEAMAH